MKRRSGFLFSVALLVMLTASATVVHGQHEGGMVGGSVGESSSHGAMGRRVPVKPAAPRKRPTPNRRGTTAEQYVQQGDRFFDGDQYAEALGAYLKAVGLKQIGHAYYRIGWIKNEQQNYQEAVDPLQRAMRLMPADALAPSELGYSYYKLSRSQEAIASYRQAISLGPNYGTAYLGLGDVYYLQTKQYREAADAYARGLKLRPDNATAFYRLSWCYNELGNYTEAIPAANEAIRLKADYAAAFFERGYAQLKLGRKEPAGSTTARRYFNDALASYREAVRLRSDYAAAYTSIGDIYFTDLKQYQPAASAYAESIRYSPDNARVRYNLGWSYNDLRRYAEAAQQLQEAVRLKPEDYSALTELGFAYHHLQRFPQAIETLRNAIRLNRDFALAHYYLGLVFLDQGNKRGAFEQYQILQRLDPEKANELYQRYQKTR